MSSWNNPWPIRQSSHSLFFNNIIDYFIFIFVFIFIWFCFSKLSPEERIQDIGQVHLLGELPGEAALQALLRDKVTLRLPLPGVIAILRPVLQAVKAILRLVFLGVKSTLL